MLLEPLRNGIRQYKKRRLSRPHAVRKPRDYAIRRPGDLVQVDTLDLPKVHRHDVRPLPGKVVKQFTARDMVSCWDVIEAFSRITAQRTHTEEFHDRYMGALELRKLNQAMRQWEHIYNHIRPHYSLALRTPAEYLAQHHPAMAPTPKPSHMSGTDTLS